MPRTINPIKKAIVKRSLMQGNGAKQALIEAKFAPATAHNSTTNTVVKECLAEIAAEMLSFKDLTPEHFTKKSNLIFAKALSLKKPDLTNAMRATEFQGRISGIDRISPATIVNINDDSSITLLDTDTLTRLARRK